MNAKRLVGLYGLVVFLSAAILLVLEIVAGRLLAPYIGVSLYTWTSIIGVILAGLSLGHWIGGKLADRGAGHLTVGVALLVAAVTTLTILPLLLLVGEAIQSRGFGLLGASFVYVLSLFFMPAAAIGVLSPLLTTLALALDTRAGTVVGRMHALSAVGSIIGTFITGYWLVQWLGTRTIIWSAALALLLMALPFLLRRGRGIGALAGGLVIAGLVTLVTWNRSGFASPCDVESSYYCLRVVAEADATGVERGRSLIIDHMMHSTNSRHDPSLLMTPYIHAMDTLINAHFLPGQPRRYLFGGGGAYTLPRAIAYREPRSRITVSEIDPAVTRLAREALYFDPAPMTIHHGDVRNLLRRSDDHVFDVVVTDVFHDIGIPWHLTTREFNDEVARALTPDGIYLVNVIDVFPANRLVQSMLSTLQGSFEHVGVWIEQPPETETRLTFVMTASHRAMDTARLDAETAPARTWFDISDFVAGQAAQSDAPEITDSYAPVERLLERMLVTRRGN